MLALAFNSYPDPLEKEGGAISLLVSPPLKAARDSSEVEGFVQSGIRDRLPVSCPLILNWTWFRSIKLVFHSERNYQKVLGSPIWSAVMLCYSWNSSTSAAHLFISFELWNTELKVQGSRTSPPWSLPWKPSPNSLKKVPQVTWFHFQTPWKHFNYSSGPMHQDFFSLGLPETSSRTIPIHQGLVKSCTLTGWQDFNFWHKPAGALP